MRRRRWKSGERSGRKKEFKVADCHPEAKIPTSHRRLSKCGQKVNFSFLLIYTLVMARARGLAQRPTLTHSDAPTHARLPELSQTETQPFRSSFALHMLSSSHSFSFAAFGHAEQLSICHAPIHDLICGRERGRERLSQTDLRAICNSHSRNTSLLRPRKRATSDEECVIFGPDFEGACLLTMILGAAL